MRDRLPNDKSFYQAWLEMKGYNKVIKKDNILFMIPMEFIKNEV